jgi:transcriptional regulator with XRE-family HTH domain
MSTFGSKVYELLDRVGKDAAWLAAETGISAAAISLWKTDAKRMPKASSVKKVYRAFQPYGVSLDEIAEAAEIAIRPSKDLDERESRRIAFLRSNPRAARHNDRIMAMGPEAQDELFSYAEYLEARERKKATRRRPPTPPKSQ